MLDQILSRIRHTEYSPVEETTEVVRASHDLSTNPAIGPEKQIDILLEEYRAVREEKLSNQRSADRLAASLVITSPGTVFTVLSVIDASGATADHVTILTPTLPLLWIIPLAQILIVVLFINHHGWGQRMGAYIAAVEDKN